MCRPSRPAVDVCFPRYTNASYPVSLVISTPRTRFPAIYQHFVPGFPRYTNASYPSRQVFLVEELLVCSLHDYIYHPHSDRSPIKLLSLARDVAVGLAYLHPTILHRDLKPR